MFPLPNSLFRISRKHSCLVIIASPVKFNTWHAGIWGKAQPLVLQAPLTALCLKCRSFPRDRSFGTTGLGSASRHNFSLADRFGLQPTEETPAMNFRVTRWLAAGLLALLAGSPLHAAWNNVFQVCCNSCGAHSSASYYAPQADPCNPCPPPPCCTTRYIQRSYYQPVVTYQTKTYYEPVTTYRTSYFWEPVQTVRYTSFYDPSCCCFRQQACP